MNYLRLRFCFFARRSPEAGWQEAGKLLLKGKDSRIEAERSGIDSDGAELDDTPHAFLRWQKRARKRHTQFLAANRDIVHIRRSG